MQKAWWLLIFAGLTEVIWVAGLKHATLWWEWLVTIIFILLSFKILIDAASKLPIGTVYAVFTGLGTGGTVVVEIFLFNESADLLKILLISTLTLGVIGLKMSTKEEQESDVSCHGSH